MLPPHVLSMSLRGQGHACTAQPAPMASLLGLVDLAKRSPQGNASHLWTIRRAVTGNRIDARFCKSMQVFTDSLLRVPPAMVAHHNPWVQAFRVFRPMGYPSAFILDIDPISIVDSQVLRRLGVDVEDRVRTLGPQTLYLSEIGMPENRRLSGCENEGILVLPASGSLYMVSAGSR